VRSHDHIVRRYSPALMEEKPAGDKRRIEAALKEIKEGVRGLPLQQAMDICSAIMDIENALATKPEE
jgi:hypothetical protein